MPDGLERFVAAQDATFPAALSELRQGRKASHWMWWVFPQIGGLGRSPTARRYAIRDRAEAERYLAHPVLGPRLGEAAEAMLGNRGRSAEEVLGGIDAAKLRSSMTLFDALDGAPATFGRVLDAFHDGTRCDHTLARIRA